MFAAILGLSGFIRRDHLVGAAAVSAFSKALLSVLEDLRWTRDVAGQRTGVSTRTLTRWATKPVKPDVRSLRAFVAAIARVDLTKATLLADASGYGPEALGLTAMAELRPPPSAPLPEAPAIAPRLAADAILCAAAEALDTSPKSLRPVVRAIIARTRASGVPLDLLEAALGDAE